SGHVLPCDRGASAQKDSANCRPLLRAIGVVLLHRLQKGFQTEVRPHVYGIALGLANVFIAISWFRGLTCSFWAENAKRKNRLKQRQLNQSFRCKTCLHLSVALPTTYDAVVAGTGTEVATPGIRRRACDAVDCAVFDGYAAQGMGGGVVVYGRQA